jgi:uncharacterized linocin/CFP29 family protein
MNNLHRELAPISDAAWAEIEEETTRTLKRYLAARRVVDVQGPGGIGLPAVGTGHLKAIAAPGDGVLARQREVKALVEFRVPVELDRQQIDDVERGADDSDWQPAKDAAQKIAYAEDRAIFEGYAAAGIVGVREGTSNPIMTLPADVRQYPDAIAQALSQLRLVGVNGPYKVLNRRVQSNDIRWFSDRRQGTVRPGFAYPPKRRCWQISAFRKISFEEDTHCRARRSGRGCHCRIHRGAGPIRIYQGDHCEGGP